MDFPVLNIKESPLYTSAYNLGFFFFSLYRLEALSTQFAYICCCFVFVWFIYLAAPDLSGGLQDLQSFCRGVQNLKLWHANS